MNYSRCPPDHVSLPVAPSDPTLRTADFRLLHHPRGRGSVKDRAPLGWRSGMRAIDIGRYRALLRYVHSLPVSVWFLIHEFFNQFRTDVFLSRQKHCDTAIFGAIASKRGVIYHLYRGLYAQYSIINLNCRLINSFVK